LVPHFGRAKLLDHRCKKVTFENEQNAFDTETSIITKVASLLNNPILVNKLNLINNNLIFTCKNV